MDAGNARRRRRRRDLKKPCLKLLVAVGILMWITVWFCPHQDGGAVQYPIVDLVPISDSQDGHDSSSSSYNEIRDFNLAGIVASLVGHPRRLLNARHIAAIPHLLTEVQGLVFAHPGYELRNHTADLNGWVQIETDELCVTLMSLYDAVAPVRRSYHSWGDSPPPSDLSDSWDLFLESEEQQEGWDDVFVGGGGQGHEREKEAKEETNKAYPDPGTVCDLASEAVVSLGGLGDVRSAAQDALNYAWDCLFDFIKALHSLRVTERVLTQADVYSAKTGRFLWREDLGPVFAVSPSTNRRWATPVERASSSSSSSYELDNFTALVLALLRGGRLLAPSPREPLPPVLGEFLHPDQPRRLQFGRKGSANYKPPLPAKWLTRKIRAAVVREADAMDRTLWVLRELVLPMARRWVDIVASEGLGTSPQRGDGDDTPRGGDHDARASHHQQQRGSEQVARLARAVVDGADHLEFLAGYLAQSAGGLWALLPRLDRWDAEVARVGSEIDYVLRSEWQLMLRPEGKRAKKGERRVIERWRIGAGLEFGEVTGQLLRLASDLKEAADRAESFDPDDDLEDSWFRRRMEAWNRERAAERAAWVSERGRDATGRQPWDTMWRNWWEG